MVAQRVVSLLRPAKARGGGCSPANIVAFTFTEKAAAELKERIHTRYRENLGDIAGLAEMYVGTIHGFCLELLKSEVPFVDRHSKASGLIPRHRHDYRSHLPLVHPPTRIV